MKDGVIKKRLVVVGGGFAGLNFVEQMFNNEQFDVTLIDRNNYNYFTPLIYQVATRHTYDHRWFGQWHMDAYKIFRVQIP